MKIRSVLLMLDGDETADQIGSYIMGCFTINSPEKIGLEVRRSSGAQCVRYIDTEGLSKGDAVAFAEKFLDWVK